jgi:putative ABC transport system substrate-binding protein
MSTVHSSFTRRRLVAGGACALLSAAGSAQLGAAHRVGFLSLGSEKSDVSTSQQAMLRASLKRMGLDDGSNLTIEWRFAEGREERLRSLAAELVKARCELIVAAFNQAIAAALAETRTLPVVMLGALVPVELGWARSLASPGGNATGTIYSSPETTGKLFEILQEAAPQARRVGVLVSRTVPGTAHYRAQWEKAATALGLRLHFFNVAKAEDIQPALQRMAASRMQAIYISGDSLINPSVREIAAFALEHQLPSVGTAAVHVRQGALFYYGPDFPLMVERVAVAVNRILAGTPPRELPIEAPAKYEFVFNRQTGQALGIQLPPALQVQVSRFVE